MKSKRQSKVTIPTRCHPLAKVIFAELKRQNLTYEELEFRSGVLRSTFKSWRVHNRPGLETVEAALGALGWHVLPVPEARTLPDGLREDLNEVAAKHGLPALPCLEFIAVAASGEYRHPEARIHDDLKRLAA